MAHQEYHVKDLRVNASKTKLTTSSGTSLITNPKFFYKDQMLLRFTVVDSLGNAVNLNTGTYQFRIVSSYATQNLLADSVNSQFVSGDWSGWSASGGKICCRVDLDEAAILAYLTNTQSDKAYCGLWATIGGIEYLLCQFDCTLYNSIS